MRYKIFIVLGSETDDEVLKASKMTDILDSVELPWEVWVASSHRHLQILIEEVRRRHKQIAGPKPIFIAAAGMAAALPGILAAITDASWPIIGVPLASAEFPDAMDALLSMVRMPPRIPIAVPGIGKSGFVNAAVLACQFVAFADPHALEFVPALESVQAESGKLKPARIPLRTSEQKNKI